MIIAYSCNDKYIPQTGISIISVCENNRSVKDILFYVIGLDVSVENQELLRTLAERYDRELRYVEFETIAFDLHVSMVGRHTATIYSKVFFSRIEGLHKVLYLDSDTVVDGSLQPLWETDLSNVYMAAVQTRSTKKRELDMSENTPFFNDGVVLVNVDYCRDHFLIENALQVLDSYGGNPPVLSEGVLNKVCQGHIRYVSLRWNCMAGLLFLGRLNNHFLSSLLDQYSESDVEMSCNHPVIIHYLAGFYNRPWFVPCTHPFLYVYQRYQKQSPWADVPPVHHPLPLRLRLIALAYKTLGCELTEKLRFK